MNSQASVKKLKMNYVSEEAFKQNKKEYRHMMTKVLNRGLRYVCTKSELESIIDEILFDSMRLFKDQGFKFSTYLYNACKNKSHRVLKKKIQIKSNEKNTNYDFCFNSKEIELIELRDILEELNKISPDLHDVLVDSFLNEMNNPEIGKKNGYCSENARKKIQKALKICQKLVYE